MSIVINGMDMPKGNSTKNLLIYSDGRVFTGHKDDVNYSAEERKTGKWIYDGDCYKCNKCGTVYGWWADSQTSNFCPNCGADMRTKETDCDYERAVDQLEHDILYEPTFNQDDGSM